MTDPHNVDWADAAARLREANAAIERLYLNAPTNTLTATAQDALHTLTRLQGLLINAVQNSEADGAENVARVLDEAHRQLGYQIGDINNVLRFHGSTEP